MRVGIDHEKDPVDSGVIYLQPKKGKFVPSWGSGGPVYKAFNDALIDAGIVGFIMELDLLTIAEVG